ncbi:MAG: hypothetical protein K5770_08030 [Lachnospiraceae bacterium]|nr:hypothetical protein [Lachnospiraceae bacterium]
MMKMKIPEKIKKIFQLIAVAAAVGLCSLYFIYDKDVPDSDDGQNRIISAMQLNSGEYTVGFVTGTSIVNEIEIH